MLRELVLPLLDLIFPPRCLHCGKPGEVLCYDCQAEVAVPAEPLCVLCGRALVVRPSDAGEAPRCPACAAGHGPQALYGLRSARTHDGAVREAILALKYQGRRRLAEPLGDLLADAAAQLTPAPTLVAPVPLHPKRQQLRGFNQAELLARRCARRLGLPYEARLLERWRSTPPQVGLSAVERRANVAGAFTLAGPQAAERIAGQVLLLIDDVTTTGSTLDAAAAAAAAARPLAVWGLAVSRPALSDDAQDVTRVRAAAYARRMS
jgi:ComF family protein